MCNKPNVVLPKHHSREPGSKISTLELDAYGTVGAVENCAENDAKDAMTHIESFASPVPRP